jgi:hypothetical protein
MRDPQGGGFQVPERPKHKPDAANRDHKCPEFSFRGILQPQRPPAGETLDSGRSTTRCSNEYFTRPHQKTGFFPSLLSIADPGQSAP